MKTFKDNFDKIIVRLGFLRQDLFELRKNNQELQLENEKLSLRAAASFENLTPRPDYQGLSSKYAQYQFGKSLPNHFKFNNDLFVYKT